MRRSTFLWLTALFGVGANSVAARSLNAPSDAPARPLEGAVEFIRPLRRATASRAGRCFASRKTSRWSGYCVTDLLAT